MKLSLNIFFIASLCFFIACKPKKSTVEPEETISPTPPTVINHQFGFKKGNWWVYTCTTTSSYTPAYNKDSLAIVQDTVIGSNTFYKFFSYKTPYANFDIFPLSKMWVRDSGNFIINSLGKKLFSTGGFTGILSQDTVYYGPPPWAYLSKTYEMAGTFTINCNSTLYSAKANPFEITANPLNYPGFGTKKYYNYVSATLGILHYEFGFLNDSNGVFKNDLLKYSIQ